MIKLTYFLALLLIFTLSKFQAQNVSKVDTLTINLLLQYEQDCYNDSTEVTYGLFTDFQSGTTYKAVYVPDDSQDIVNLVGTENGYAHKPPTFEGFIVWLKEKK